ncbi:MAG TPA: hypothetical protein VI215_10100 [Bacteroidota bacterium]|jgi:hypothetical protein
MKKPAVAAMLTLMTLLLCRPAIPAERKLLLRLSLGKTEYLSGEPVFATLSLINTRATPVNIRRLYMPFGYLRLVLKDSKGATLPLLFESSTVRDSARSVRVEPEDSSSVVIDLLPLYGKGERKLRKLHTKTFLSPGSYTVRATFQTGLGRAESRTVSFSVGKPQGSEATVHELLGRAATLELDQQQVAAAASLDSIIKNYPMSAYHVAAFLQKIYLYELDEKPEGQKVACGTVLALIDAHPESEATIPALSYYMIHSDIIGQTPADIRETLKTILQEHPDTRIAKQAYKVLKLYHADER